MSAAALTRRAALFGGVLATPMLALSGALATSPMQAAPACRVGPLSADALLIALAAEVDRTLDGAAYALAPVADHDDQNRRLDRADALLTRMSAIPAASFAGNKAKATAWLDSDSYDVQCGGDLIETLCEDIERLHKVGGLV